MKASELLQGFRSEDWKSVQALGNELLAELIDQPERYTATAHPLGFVHALVTEAPDKTRVRLHLWPTIPYRQQEPAWLVHRHSWPLTSFVVAGDINDRRFEVTPAANGDRRLYETTYVGDESVLTASPSLAVCSPAGSRRWRAGEHYVVPQDAFHASVATGPAVTIAVSGTPLGTPAVVVGTVNGPAEVRYARIELVPSELRRLATDILTNARRPIGTGT